MAAAEVALKGTWGEQQPIKYDEIAQMSDRLAKPSLISGSEDTAGETNGHTPQTAHEQELFAPRGRGAGASLSALELEVQLEGPERIEPIRSFRDAKLNPLVLANIAKSGYTVPTAIQAYGIPAALSKRDVVAIAQTGSGKTATYLAPMISNFAGRISEMGGPRPDTKSDTYDPSVDKVRAEPLALIICPTRELARQINDEALRLANDSDIRCVTVYGGMPVTADLQRLGKGCDILVGTPGRLKDLLERPEVISLRRVKFTVVDEADKMLQDTEFEEDLNKIIASGDANEDAGHQYMMFSATFPKEARTMARQYLQEDYIRIRVGRAGSTHKNIKQSIIWTDDDAKSEALHDLLNSQDKNLSLIFCNAIGAVEKLDDFLWNKGLPTTFMHGKRSQYEREDAMRAFVRGKAPIMITTALTARGIDFPDVARVINYDLPSVEHGGIEEYVHRIGRTGRIGHTGDAISFYNSRNEDLAQDLVNVLVETGQDVPDFLDHLKPADGALEFNDDSDDEDGATAGGQAGNGGWGGDPASKGDAGWAGSADDTPGWG